MDGESKPLSIRMETIGVAGGDPVELPVAHTEHGVIIEMDEERGVAYAFATPYLDQVGLVEQIHRMSVAQSLEEHKEAVMLHGAEPHADGRATSTTATACPAPRGDYTSPCPATPATYAAPPADLVRWRTRQHANCNISPGALSSPATPRP